MSKRQATSGHRWLRWAGPVSILVFVVSVIALASWQAEESAAKQAQAGITQSRTQRRASAMLDSTSPAKGLSIRTRFIFFSTLGASTRSRGRLMRAKAVAESAVTASSLEHTVFAPSIIYAPDDPYLRLLHRMSWLPVMAIPGAGNAAFAPICADDVAACVMSALPGGAAAEAAVGARYELAGPETLTHREIVALALRSFGRRRPIVSRPRTDRLSRSWRRRASMRRV